jgi:hypothetical protein
MNCKGQRNEQKRPREHLARLKRIGRPHRKIQQHEREETQTKNAVPARKSSGRSCDEVRGGCHASTGLTRTPTLRV